jgi:hypothetical protein
MLGYREFLLIPHLFRQNPFQHEGKRLATRQPYICVVGRLEKECVILTTIGRKNPGDDCYENLISSSELSTTYIYARSEPKPNAVTMP